MDWEIVWTVTALSDLEAAVRYAARTSPAAAESVRLAILDSVGQLTRFPEIGAVYERDESRRTREIVSRQYRIFYRLQMEKHRVEVLAIWHSARREPRLPK